jgi:predicted O-methyltransferase YrrM
MRLPGKKVLLLLGAASLLVLVALIALLLDSTALAAAVAVLLQGLMFVVLVLVASRQARMVGDVARHRDELADVRRRVDNASHRTITESESTRETVTESKRAVRASVRSAREHLDRRGAAHVQDVEALLQLFSRFTPRAAMTSSGAWALEPTGLLRIVDLVQTKPIRTIVELGSGTSTLWLAYALEARGTGGRIVSLDHDPHFAGLTRTALAAHGFGRDVADVRDAPLMDGVVVGHATPWYDPQSFADLAEVDLLIVDGPPQATGDLARYPALPALLDKLAPNAIIVVDDAHRPDEIEMVEQWRELDPRLRTLDEPGPGRQVFLELADRS